MEQQPETWQKPAHKLAWDTCSVVEAERFTYYREAICQAFMDLAPEYPKQGQRRFHAQVESTPLGAGAVNHVHATSHQIMRTRSEVAAADAACFYLNLQLKGECIVKQSGSQTVISAGQVGIFDSDRPFVLETERLPELQVASFWVPQAALAERLPEGLPTVPVRLSDDPALGRLIAETARTLSENADFLPAEVGAKLFDVLLDLVALEYSGTARARVDERAALHRGLLLAVRRSIADGLRDPELSVANVAACHGISVRYVHKLFENSDTTFGEYVIAARLDGAAHDLMDPAKAHLPVTTIAFDWAFKEHSHFTRRFKQRFGTTPRNWRHRYH